MLVSSQAEPGGEEGDPVVEGSEDYRSVVGQNTAGSPVKSSKQLP